MNDATQFFNTSGGGYEIERSLRFNSSDSAYLSRTPSVAGNRKTWTWAGWVKRSNLSTWQMLLSAGSTVNDRTYIAFVGSDNPTNVDQLVVASSSGGALVGAVYANPKLRDLSAWYHLVVAVDTTQATAADRVKIYINGTTINKTTSTSFGSSADTQVNNTVIHQTKNAASSTEYFNGYLADVHFIDGQALDPTSFTEVDATTGQLIPKAYTGSFGTNGFHLDFSDNSAATATTIGADSSGNGNNWTPNNLSVLNKSGTFTGPIYSGNGTFSSPGSPWIPIPNWHLWFDGDLSTFGAPYAYYGTSTSTLNFATAVSGSTIRFYAENPSQPGTFPDDVGTTMYVRLNGGTAIALTFTASGTAPNAVGWTDPISIPGSSLTQLIVYHSATPHRSIRIYGVEVGGVLLNEITLADVDTDSLLDTPTSYGDDTGAGGEVRGNYATWNPLSGYADPLVLSNGNLQAAATGTNGAGNWKGVSSTISSTSGKWYAEFLVTGIGGSNHVNIGINPPSRRVTPLQGDSTSGHYYNSAGSFWNAGAYGGTASTYTTGDIIGVAVDMDGSSVKWYKNGGLENTVSLNSNITNNGFQFALALYTTSEVVANFGQRPFAYIAPSGFKALCTTNLPAPVVAKSASAFDVKLYTATDGVSGSVSGVNFSPDFVWIKSRAVARSNVLMDTVRGTSSVLWSNLTDAQLSSSQYVSQFNSDGFNYGAAGDVSNGSTVAWLWDAGSSTVTNTQGSITSSVRANASAGFSIVQLTSQASGAATVGHGLGVAPQFLIVKIYNISNSWFVYHNSIGSSNYLLLDSTGAATSNSVVFNSTSPTSTVYSLGSGFAGGYSIISYCFAPVAGYSSFGSYTGNGSADGPFVYTGFRPRWLLLKNASNTANWYLLDSARNTYNVVNSLLRPNLSNAELTGVVPVDFLSNGFKIRDNDFGSNANANTIVYAAFAENPFQYARAR